MITLRSIEIYDAGNGLARAAGVYMDDDDYVPAGYLYPDIIEIVPASPYWLVKKQVERMAELEGVSIYNHMELTAGVPLDESLAKMKFTTTQ